MSSNVDGGGPNVGSSEVGSRETETIENGSPLPNALDVESEQLEQVVAAQAISGSSSGVNETENKTGNMRAKGDVELTIINNDGIGKSKSLTSNDSLMADVRDRMKEDNLDKMTDRLAPQYYVGDERVEIDHHSHSEVLHRSTNTMGHSAFSSALSSSNYKREEAAAKSLPVKEFCGHDWLFSLRFSLTAQYTLLISLAMLTVALFISLENRSLRDLIWESCQATTVSVLNGGTQVVEQTTELFAKNTVASFTITLRLYALLHPKQAVGSLYNFMLAREFGGDNLVLNNLLLDNVTGFFMVRQLDSFFTSLPLLYGASTDNSVRGYDFPRYLTTYACGFENFTQVVNFTGPDIFTAIPADIALEKDNSLINSSVANSLAALQRCRASNQTGLPFENECDNITGYNTTERPYFLAQSELNGTNDQSIGIWTDFYLFDGVQNSFGDPDGNVYGVSFTWPINFCGDYTCFDGVLAADVTTEVISNATTVSFDGVIGNLDDEENFSLENADRSVILSLCFYVVIRENSQYLNTTSQTGILIGGTVVDEEKLNEKEIEGCPVVINTLQSALDSQHQSIRNATEYLQKTHGNFSEPYYDNITFNSFSIEDLSPCHCTTLATIDTYTNPDEILSQSCITVSTSPISDSEIVGFPTPEGIDWLAINVVPCSLFTQDYFNILERVTDTITDTNNQVSDETTRLTILSVIVVIIFIALMASFSIFLAYLISKPIKRLSAMMEKLKTFSFEADDTLTPSRIKEVHKMQETFVALRGALETFAKFVPTTTVRNIVHGGENSRRVHVRHRQVTIMFSDIAGFTTIAEKLPIKELLYVLTTYLTVMTKIIESFQGVVAEILGDGLLVFWNTPDDIDDHAAKALATALACQKAVRHSLNHKFKDVLEKYGLGPLSVRIGIHTGKVLTGNIGSDQKMKFGCMGDPVNLASRLEGLCKLYGVEIICSEDTLKLLPSADVFLVRELDLVRVKGKTEPTKLYQVISQDVNVESSTPFVTKAGSNKVEKKKTFGNGKISKFKSQLRRNSKSSAHKSSNIEKGDKSTVTRMVFHVEDLNIDEDYRKRVKLYEEALACYQNGDFSTALKLALSISPADMATKYLIERIEHAQEPKPNDDAANEKWTGVNILYGKDF